MTVYLGDVPLPLDEGVDIIPILNKLIYAEDEVAAVEVVEDDEDVPAVKTQRHRKRSKGSK